MLPQLNPNLHTLPNLFKFEYALWLNQILYNAGIGSILFEITLYGSYKLVNAICPYDYS
jgi:hypothetical protein